MFSALLKQQGGGVKGMTKGTPVNEEVPPLLDGGGKMEVNGAFSIIHCHAIATTSLK